MVTYNRDERNDWRSIGERVLRSEGQGERLPNDWDHEDGLRPDELRFARNVGRLLREEMRESRLGREGISSERFGRFVGEGFRAVGYALADVLHRAGLGGDRADRGERGWERSLARGADPWRRGLGPKGYVRSDERIKEDVSDALTEHPAIDASDVEVEVKHGVIMLTGTVATRQEKRLAEDVLENVLGMKDITNHLRVKARNMASHS